MTTPPTDSACTGRSARFSRPFRAAPLLRLVALNALGFLKAGMTPAGGMVDAAANEFAGKTTPDTESAAEKGADGVSVPVRAALSDKQGGSACDGSPRKRREESTSQIEDRDRKTSALNGSVSRFVRAVSSLTRAWSRLSQSWHSAPLYRSGTPGVTGAGVERNPATGELKRLYVRDAAHSAVFLPVDPLWIIERSAEDVEALRLAFGNRGLFETHALSVLKAYAALVQGLPSYAESPFDAEDGIFRAGLMAATASVNVLDDRVAASDLVPLERDRLTRAIRVALLLLCTIREAQALTALSLWATGGQKSKPNGGQSAGGRTGTRLRERPVALYDPVAESVRDFGLRHPGATFSFTREPASGAASDGAALSVFTLRAAERLMPDATRAYLETTRAYGESLAEAVLNIAAFGVADSRRDLERLLSGVLLRGRVLAADRMRERIAGAEGGARQLTGFVEAIDGLIRREILAYRWKPNTFSLAELLAEDGTQESATRATDSGTGGSAAPGHSSPLIVAEDGLFLIWPAALERLLDGRDGLTGAAHAQENPALVARALAARGVLAVSAAGEIVRRVGSGTLEGVCVVQLAAERLVRVLIARAAERNRAPAAAALAPLFPEAVALERELQVITETAAPATSASAGRPVEKAAEEGASAMSQMQKIEEESKEESERAAAPETVTSADVLSSERAVRSASPSEGQPQPARGEKSSEINPDRDYVWTLRRPEAVSAMVGLVMVGVNRSGAPARFAATEGLFIPAPLLAKAGLSTAELERLEVLLPADGVSVNGAAAPGVYWRARVRESDKKPAGLLQAEAAALRRRLAFFRPFAEPDSTEDKPAAGNALYLEGVVIRREAVALVDREALVAAHEVEKRTGGKLRGRVLPGSGAELVDGVLPAAWPEPEIELIGAATAISAMTTTETKTKGKGGTVACSAD